MNPTGLPFSLAFLCAASFCFAQAPDRQAGSVDLPPGEIIDLSYPFDATTIFWPTEEGFIFKKGFEGKTDKGFYYTANTFCTAEHGGTHIDAPIHFAEGRLTVDQIPLDQLMGRAIVVDVSKKCSEDRDYQISVEDVLEWEKTHGQIPRGTIVLLRTGNGAHWPDRVRYMGTDERGAAAVAKLHFPGLHPDAARWLVANRMVKAVGLDTPSIDHGQSSLFETHQVLFDKNVPALENVANLDRLPPTGALVMALPMKIKGGSGGPCRIVAIVPKR